MKKIAIAILLSTYSFSSMAEIISINNVKVSADDASATAAREKAIAEGHRIAAQQVLSEMGRTDIALPPDSELMSMASGMSIVREKNTNTSYTAILNIQFDSDKLLGGESPNAISSQTQNPAATFSETTRTYNNPAITNNVELAINYGNMQEFLKITDDLKSSSATINLELKELSSNRALYKITIGGDEIAWKNHLREQLGWNLSGTNGKFVLVMNNN